MRKWPKFSTLVVGLSTACLAQSSLAYYCSTQSGRGYINIGDNTQQVSRICGTPTSTSEADVQDTSFTTTEYWSYSNIDVKQSSPLGVSQPQPRVTNAGPMVTFQIKNGQVSSISEGGRPVQSTDSCGPPIGVGTSSDSVLSDCGNPNNTGVENTPSKRKKKVITWTYDRGQYSSPLILNFEDDKLTAING